MSQEMSQGSLRGWGNSPPAPAWPSSSPSPIWGDPLNMFGQEGSVSPPQARAPSPTFDGVRESSLSPKKERPRSRSPLSGTRQNSERGPRIFVINCHGVTFPDENGNPAMIDYVPVDTFTSVKFGHGFGKYLYNAQTCSFFDEPYRYVIDKILETTKRNTSSLQKDSLRKVIGDSLCYVRDVTGVIVRDKCKFRCHRVGRKMADMYIMGAGSPLDEAVICINPFTGEEEDVYDKFGLRQLDDRLITYPHGRNVINKAYDIAIRKAEGELDDLRSQMSMLSQPHLKTAENMDIVKKLRIQYDAKFLKLDTIKEALRDAVKGSKYRYKRDFQGKYDIIDGKHHMIKLSDAIEIAIRNGTIDPEIDFIVVQACRNFYGQLPSGFDFTKTRGSPGRAGTGSETDSQGGGGHAKCKYSRKKYGKNKGRNKNKNKRKTIRNRKSIKSNKLRKRSKSL
jgi:hypothetical protein